MMQVNITQFNVQLYFREPVLDSETLKGMFTGADGFATTSAATAAAEETGRGAHPMSGSPSFYRGGFRIAPVQSNVLPFRILQVMSYPNALAEPDAETLECLRLVSARLEQGLHVDLGRDIYAVRTVSHSIVTSPDDNPATSRALSRISGIENVPTLAGRYVAHKNPMGALQLVTRTGNDLVQESWSDIRVSQFGDRSYVVTIFNETSSLAAALESIRGVKQFVSTLMQEIELACSCA